MFLSFYDFVFDGDYLQSYIRHAFCHVRHETFCDVFQKKEFICMIQVALKLDHLA